MNIETLKIMKEALTIVSEKEIAAIDRIIADAPTPPDKVYDICDKRAQEIINEQKKSISTSKIISILVAATLIISLLCVVAYATKDKIGGFFIEFYEKYAKFTNDNTEDEFISLPQVTVGYIPEGFTEIRRVSDTFSTMHEWKNNDKIISLYYRATTENGSLAVDTENSNYTVIQIDEILLHRTEKFGQIGVVWTDDKVLYTLTCSGIEWDEIVNIVKGIKLNNTNG